MITIDQIRARCAEVGDCWIWQGATSNTGYLIIKVKGCNCQFVRRVVFRLGGLHLQPRQPVITTCEDKLCVNPEHLRSSTVADVAKAAAQRGAFSGLARAAKIAASKRSTAAKLDMEKAREIRVSEESGPVLAARYGVNKSVINNIKRGVSWKDHTNPFFALGAR